MPGVGIITDSIACLPAPLVERYQIEVVPLNIYYNGHVYHEGVDISAAEAYDLMDRDPESFSTSPASVGDYETIFNDMAARYRQICCITISSKLSTLSQMARIASREVTRRHPETDIAVVDSLNAGGGEGMIVMAAAQAAADGGELPEVLDATACIQQRCQAYGLFETIRHIHRTGRIPKTVSQIGARINIKPIFHLSGGRIKLISAARTRQSGMQKLLDIMTSRHEVKNPRRVFVAHAGDPEGGEQLKAMVEASCDCGEIWLSDFSPVMGYATGRGTLMLAYCDNGG